MPAPSNLDIMQTLGRIEEKVDRVQTQVNYTNGKVASLMEDKIRRDERDKVLAENKSAPVATTKEGNIVVAPPASYWTSKEKLYGALAGAATLAATALAVALGVKQ